MFIRYMYRRYLFLIQFKFKHYSQFLNSQLHRFIIQSSLCCCIYFDEVEKQIVNGGGGGVNGQTHA